MGRDRRHTTKVKHTSQVSQIRNNVRGVSPANTTEGYSALSLHVEYAEQRLKCGFRFLFRPAYEHSNLEYEHVVTGAGIAVHTNPCERLSVRVVVARVALRQCLRLRRVRLSLSVTHVPV